MKSIYRLAAVIMVMLLLLTACGGGDQTESDGNDGSAAVEESDSSAEDGEATDPADAEDKDSGSGAEEPYIDYLVLVNHNHRLPDGWEEKLRLATTVNSVGDEVKVEKGAYNMYLLLKLALERKGIHVELDSAYRSVAEQQQIVDDFTEKYGAAYTKAYVAVPGYSEHHTGLALDLYLIVDGVTVYENEDLVQNPEIWAEIHELLPYYGFILRYPEGGNTGYVYEPWHIRFVGIGPAKEITERGIVLEEYLGEY
ncbi:MAG: M15 family metallopeptidase [Mogibacterium sp.]|nr:M15 family metallopeptidase [Mogibacterium sp.]